MTLIVMRGLPASGKSRWAAQYVAEDPENRVAVSRDGFRAMLSASDDCPHGLIEDEITALHEASVEYLLARGKSVVVDATNLPARRVRSWLTLAETAGVDWLVQDFTDVPLDVCLKRNAGRDRVVDEDVIRSMHSKFIRGGKKPAQWTPLAPKKTAALDVEPYEAKDGTPEAILVDIDGTLARMTDRGPFDWKRVGEDQPVQTIIDYVRMHYAAGRTVIVMSGRLDVCRTETEEWLEEHLQIPFVGPFMRDRTEAPDDQIKLELFNKHIRDNYTIHSVLDDRDRVVKMWRELGLTCLQVAPGDF